MKIEYDLNQTNSAKKKVHLSGQEVLMEGT